MGGEKITRIAPKNCGSGSPPRGRGKEQGDGVAVLPNGITPAWAGKRQTAAMPRTMTRDHPRVGGEKPPTVWRPSAGSGSPPRGRGKEKYGIGMTLPSRITPAWAGKRRPQPKYQPPCRDHPRVGGEKLLNVGDCIPVGGSPPRGRGKVSVQPNKKERMGITPAWAGKSPLSLCPREPS